jgi:predicted transcriptional regulator
MAQVTIYLPDDVERRVRREARKARTSVSAWIVRALSGAQRDAAWTRRFDRLVGSMPDLRVPEDADLEPLDEP